MCGCVARCIHICVTGHITRVCVLHVYVPSKVYTSVFQGVLPVVVSGLCYMCVLQVCVTRSVLQVLLAFVTCVLPVCNCCYRCVLQMCVIGMCYRCVMYMLTVCVTGV